MSSSTPTGSQIIQGAATEEENGRERVSGWKGSIVQGLTPFQSISGPPNKL